ncbi:Hypothetical predicted protein [Cloeon dipterum]|uniref:BTB domain-containing protein n=1 Tax=Cloeon dipterum TaxID=197152 RepID=A0A8S1CF16_9INSE|nr:Hypothetical predicted protein [Cloeon dipterum]
MVSRGPGQTRLRIQLRRVPSGGGGDDAKGDKIRLCGEEGGGEMGSASQQYCLRWNNHYNNMMNIFGNLYESELFADCSLACEGQIIKCHRVVLAACSTYFLAMLQDITDGHPVIVLNDILCADMRALMDYMYRGEVNVGQEQLASLLKAAEVLKIKGLVEEGHHGLSSNGGLASPQSPPTITTSVNSVHRSLSPPHSNLLNQLNKYSNMYSKSILSSSAVAMAAADRARIGMPMWPMPHLPQGMPPMPGHPHNTSTSYDSPLKRKKLHSSVISSRDTPILRNVLGQNLPAQTAGNLSSTSPPGSSQSPAADSSQQPVSLVCHPERVQSNGSAHSRSFKGEAADDDHHSYSDMNVDEEVNEATGKMMMPGSTHPTYSGDVKSGIAAYVPATKPEWKRYKQYTRSDITSAIDAVRSGMSALQAARKYGVPSRTLYDKVKKLGITTSRPFKRGSFQYSAGALSASQENLNHSSSTNFCNQSDAEEQVSSDTMLDKSDETTVASVHLRPSRSPSPAGMPAHFMSGSNPGVNFRSSSSPSPTGSSGGNHSPDEVEDLSVSGTRKSSPLPAPTTPVAVPITPLHPHIVSLKDSNTLEDASPVRTTTVGGGDAKHD